MDIIVGQIDSSIGNRSIQRKPSTFLKSLTSIII